MLIPATEITVHDFLKRNGPMTLSELSSYTALPVDTLRNHLRIHRDAYTSTLDRNAVRHWSVYGDIK